MLKVELKSSFKIASGKIIPAGKIFSADTVEELPEWLKPLVEKRHSSLNIKGETLLLKVKTEKKEEEVSTPKLKKFHKRSK